MTPRENALLILLELGEYAGPMDAFMRESVTSVRAKLNCAEEESERLIKSLQDAGEIDFSMTSGGQLPAGENIAVAKWYWYIPQS